MHSHPLSATKGKTATTWRRRRIPLLFFRRFQRMASRDEGLDAPNQICLSDGGDEFASSNRTLLPKSPWCDFS